MDVILAMGDKFRGLWHVKEMQDDGSISHKWSCTVFKDGDIVDTQGSDTPGGAISVATKIVFGE